MSLWRCFYRFEMSSKNTDYLHFRLLFCLQLVRLTFEHSQPTLHRPWRKCCCLVDILSYIHTIFFDSTRIGSLRHIHLIRAIRCKVIQDESYNYNDFLQITLFFCFKFNYRYNKLFIYIYIFCFLFLFENQCDLQLGIDFRIKYF